MKKRILIPIFIFITVLLLGTAAISAQPEKEGAAFSADTYYKAETPFREPIVTFEAWVRIPNSVISGADTCIIISNDEGYDEAYLGFGVNKRGIPQIYYNEADGDGHTFTFKGADVRTGEWEHFAIVIDNDAMQAYCYVNGELAVTLETDEVMNGVYDTPYFIGNDGNTGKPNYFKGELGAVSLYSDMRTADEIAADFLATVPDGDGLIAHYELSVDANGVVSDGASGLYGMRFVDQWLRDKEYLDPEEYDFAFAVVGDTQKLMAYHTSSYPKIYDWLVDRVEERKIKLVMGLGDVTEDDTDKEWQKAVENITRLDGLTRYTLIAGNHDSAKQLEKYFPYENYSEYIGGCYEENSIANSWQEIEVEGIKYLILCLDYNPNAKILEWAGEVCASHPDHNVIITTHSYLNIKGERNKHGEKIWEDLASLYENVVLVLAGHEHVDPIKVLQSEGVHGNTVTQMLINPQSIDEFNTPMGMVALFYFSEGGTKLTVEYVSTIVDMHYTEESQFTIDIPVVGVPVPAAKMTPRVSPTVIIAAAVFAVAVIAVIAAVAIAVKKKKRKA